MTDLPVGTLPALVLNCSVSQMVGPIPLPNPKLWQVSLCWACHLPLSPKGEKMETDFPFGPGTDSPSQAWGRLGDCMCLPTGQDFPDRQDSTQADTPYLASNSPVPICLTGPGTDLTLAWPSQTPTPFFLPAQTWKRTLSRQGTPFVPSCQTPSLGAGSWEQ